MMEANQWNDVATKGGNYTFVINTGPGEKALVCWNCEYHTSCRSATIPRVKSQDKISEGKKKRQEEI
jgi:hypothetical protein